MWSVPGSARFTPRPLRRHVDTPWKYLMLGNGPAPGGFFFAQTTGPGEKGSPVFMQFGRRCSKSSLKEGECDV